MNPPLCYFNTVLDNMEVVCLLNELTRYYSQTDDVDDVTGELVVSNNEWVPVKDDDGRVLGRQRHDINISLRGLCKVIVESEKIIFMYVDGSSVDVDVGKDFFYYME